MILVPEDNLPLYSSNKDIGAVQQEEVKFSPVIEPQYVVNPPPKVQTTLFTTVTPIPQSLTEQVPEEIPAQVVHPKLKKKKVGIIDGLTNFVYNILFKSKK